MDEFVDILDEEWQRCVLPCSRKCSIVCAKPYGQKPNCRKTGAFVTLRDRLDIAEHLSAS